MTIRFAVYYQSREHGEYLQKFINSSGQGQLLEFSPLTPLPGEVNSETDVIFLDYQEDNPRLDRWIEKTTTDPRNPPIFFFLEAISTATLLKALHLGVKECFAYPIKEKEFQEALQRLPRHSGQAVAGGYAHIVSFLGCKGGVGNTFLTSNVAHLLSREHQGKVLVVDLDLRYGQIVYFFDAKPKYTILDVAENLERLDSSYLQSLFYPCDEYLSLLPAPERLEEAEVFTPAHLEKILSYLKNIRVFRWILLDCCHQMDEVTVKALELSDELMLVTTQSVPALSNARKMLAALELLHLEDLQVALWLNFWQKHGDLTLAEVEDFLGREISGTVRFEPKEVGRSINEGHPLTEILPGHPVSQDLKVIATRIQGEEFLEDHEVSGWSWLKHLWRRG